MSKEYVEYDSNNSGGRWWLDDDDWQALEKAGWKVEWATLQHVYDEDDRGYIRDEDGTPKLVKSEPGSSNLIAQLCKDGRYLGALARGAYRVGLSLEDAVAEWERITGKSSTDAGCPCCGQPHTFTLFRDGEYVTSGPNTSYSASW